jgi:hypothetical protein
MKEITVQYMLMCCFDEAAWNNLPDAQKDKIMREMGIGYKTSSTLAAFSAGQNSTRRRQRRLCV